MAMAENFVTRLQLIVLKGTDANFLRLMAIANDVFKPGKHEKNGDGGGLFGFLRLHGYIAVAARYRLDLCFRRDGENADHNCQ